MEYNENTRQYHKICRQFKRLLKTYLFGGWDRGALWHLLGAPCINHLTYLLKSKWCNNNTDTFKCIINEWAVPICSDLGDRVNCRMPQSERKRRVTFWWKQAMEAVLRMNIFNILINMFLVFYCMKCPAAQHLEGHRKIAGFIIYG